MRALLIGIAALTLVTSPALADHELEKWLRIHNESSEVVCEIYISHVGTGNWQQNRVYECLSPGEVVRVDPGWQQGYCKMDMLFITTNGNSAVRYDFNICDETDYYLYD